MKYLLITGGAGFIGSNTIDHFLNKYPDYIVINLDKLSYASSLKNMSPFWNNPRHIFVKGDITDADLVDSLFSSYDLSGIIHFAAESHVDNSITQPDIFIKSNILGTFTLLEAAKKYWNGKEDKRRFYHISTDEVYGSLGKTGYFTEESAYAPNSPYSASKASSDHLVRSYFKTYHLNTLITNCSNNYGPHQHREKLIPKIIHNALSGKPIPIYGTGNNIRDWLYVQDHCEAIDLLFHQAKPGEHYNIGGCHEMTNLQIAHLICKELRSINGNVDCFEDLIIFVNDRPGHDFRYAVSIEKLAEDFHWRPSTSFNLGLRSTIKFYVEHGYSQSTVMSPVNE